MNNSEKNKRPEGASNDGPLAPLANISNAIVALKAPAAVNSAAETKHHKLAIMVNDVLDPGGETAMQNILRLQTDLPQRIQDNSPPVLPMHTMRDRDQNILGLQTVPSALSH